jgi:predicted sulfurtransferase
VRQQIVADGLDKSLDWEKAGYDMPPMEWHEKLKEAKEDSGNNSEDKPLIFDCRNDYETSVGRFDGAIPLNTTNFRDSWEVLGEQLKDAPKDKPIMTYCTGGIRCVKVGAYLTQELGFTNVSRLAGGIIAYDRTLNDESPEAEPMFKGTNFVFDGRLGRQITDDFLGECITCGAKTNLISNCNNGNCHKRMVQCIDCKEKYLGTCSHACKNVVMKSANLPSKDKISNNEVQYSNIDDYSVGHSTAVPSLYKEIEHNTAMYLGSGLHMLSDAAQGMLLKNLAATSREGRVLEIGSFTGYSTSRFLEGAADAAEVIGNGEEIGSRERGSFVMSLERDQRAIDLTAFHIETLSKHGIGEEAAQAASKLRDGDVERK